MFADDENDNPEEQPATEEPLPEPEEFDEAAETLVMGSRPQAEEAPKAEAEEPPEAEAPPQPEEEAEAPEAAQPAGDDWVTVDMSKKPAVAPPVEDVVPATAPAEQDEWVASEAAAPAAQPPAAQAASVPSPAAAPVAPAAPVAEVPPAPPREPSGNFLGPVGDLLAKIGISDRQTQQWVSIGVAALVVLCCACACILIVYSLASGSSSF